MKMNRKYKKRGEGNGLQGFFLCGEGEGVILVEEKGEKSLSGFTKRQPTKK